MCFMEDQNPSEEENLVYKLVAVDANGRQLQMMSNSSHSSLSVVKEKLCLGPLPLDPDFDLGNKVWILVSHENLDTQKVLVGHTELFLLGEFDTLFLVQYASLIPFLSAISIYFRLICFIHLFSALFLILLLLISEHSLPFPSLSVSLSPSITVNNIISAYLSQLIITFQRSSKLFIYLLFPLL